MITFQIKLKLRRAYCISFYLEKYLQKTIKSCYTCQSPFGNAFCPNTKQKASIYLPHILLVCYSPCFESSWFFESKLMSRNTFWLCVFIWRCILKIHFTHKSLYFSWRYFSKFKLTSTIIDKIYQTNSSFHVE